MTGTTLVYSGRTTNWPVIAAALAGGLALVVLGRPWDGPWPGMLGPIAIVVVPGARSGDLDEPARDDRAARRADPLRRVRLASLHLSPRTNRRR